MHVVVVVLGIALAGRKHRFSKQRKQLDALMLGPCLFILQVLADTLHAALDLVCPALNIKSKRRAAFVQGHNMCRHLIRAQHAAL